MITFKELNPHNYPTTPEIEANLSVLLTRLNQLRTAYGVPMIVTSGLRSVEQQQRLIATGISNATKSHHLSGQAADIYDPHNALYQWCQNNVPVLEQCGLWCEEDRGFWVHFQSIPPKSGKRFFKP